MNKQRPYKQNHLLSRFKLKGSLLNMELINNVCQYIYVHQLWTCCRQNHESNVCFSEITHLAADWLRYTYDVIRPHFDCFRNWSWFFRKHLGFAGNIDNFLGHNRDLDTGLNQLSSMDSLRLPIMTTLQTGLSSHHIVS